MMEDADSNDIQAPKAPAATKPKKVMSESQRANLEKGRKKLDEVRKTVKQYENEKKIKQELELEEMIKSSLPQKVEERLKKTLDDTLEQKVNDIVGKIRPTTAKKAKRVVYESVDEDDSEEEEVIVKRRPSTAKKTPSAVASKIAVRENTKPNPFIIFY